MDWYGMVRGEVVGKDDEEMGSQITSYFSNVSMVFELWLNVLPASPVK